MKKFISTLCKFTLLVSALTAVLSAGMFSADTITFTQGVATVTICITAGIVSFATLYFTEGGSNNGKRSYM